MNIPIPASYTSIPMGNGSAKASFDLKGNRLKLIKAALSLAKRAEFVFEKPTVMIGGPGRTPDLKQCAAAAEALYPGIVARRDDWPAESKVAKHYQRVLDDAAQTIADSFKATGRE